MFPDELNINTLINDALANYKEGRDLIPVQQGEINGKQQIVCDARDLHAVLGVGRDFSNWIKGRINEYGFVEGKDYAVVLETPNLAFQERRHGGARKIIDYHLTSGMAKEVSMVENNDVGRKVRRHFIACEDLVDRVVRGHIEALRAEIRQEVLYGSANLYLRAKLLDEDVVRAKAGKSAKIERLTAENDALTRRVRELEEGGRHNKKQWETMCKGKYGFMIFDYLDGR